jgi:biopolymer transport protein ExbD
MAKKTPEVNASSMADIAFLLLIFFLVSTTMNVDSGIMRVLPPMPEEEQEEVEDLVHKRNVLLVFISANDEIMVGGERMEIYDITNKVKEFVMNPNNDPHLPEREEKEIDILGTYPVSKGIVSLQNDRVTSYAAYLKVQNELVRAFNEIRDNFAMANWGKKYSELEEDQQRIVRDAIPQSISEAEPKEVKKRR